MSEQVTAAVLTAPGRYELQEFPRPELPDGSLLMQMEMSGICGTDKHTYLGETKQYAGTPAESDTPFPIIQGHENVGIVSEITPDRGRRPRVLRQAAEGRRPDHDVPRHRLRPLLRVQARHGVRVVREQRLLRQLVLVRAGCPT